MRLKRMVEFWSKLVIVDYPQRSRSSSPCQSSRGKLSSTCVLLDIV